MTIITGDCLEVMKSFPDNHFSAIVTDPPYGLSFMGKGWDHAVPGIAYWESCLRCLKPGGFLLAMGGTRTNHRLASAIENAGFGIRDTVMWLYGSGFPKSYNHFGIEGYGTALKPAFEPIIMAMKPCDGTFAQNAAKWGQAGINIDGCLIRSKAKSFIDNRDQKKSYVYGKYNPSNYDGSKGRWPSNVILDEEAARMLDEQTKGTRAEKASCIGQKNNGTAFWGHGKPCDVKDRGYYADYGGASRFFYCAKTSSRERNEGLEEFPEKEGGIKNSAGRGYSETDPNRPVITKNNHPTVKPLKLMEYLIRLVMPPKDGLLLDPFAGSGSTIVAAKRLGFEAIGIEKCEEYAEIARARVAHASLKKESEQMTMDLKSCGHT